MMLIFDTILELIHRALVNSLISDHLLDLHILHMLQIRRYTIKDFFFIHEEFQSSLIAQPLELLNQISHTGKTSSLFMSLP